MQIVVQVVGVASFLDVVKVEVEIIEEVVEVVEAPVVSVEITEKEGLGDIPKRKKKDENV